MKLNKLAAIPAIAIAAGIGLAACGTDTPAPTTTVTAPPPVTTPAAVPPVIINNNNNPAPAPAPTVYVPVQAPAAPAAPAVQSDPWSVVVAYTNDVNTPGGNWAAWSLLGPSVQAGWNSNYNTFVAWADPTSFRNVNEISESGGTVTFTFDLHNGTYGTSVPYTATFTVDNGIITSSTSSPN